MTTSQIKACHYPVPERKVVQRRQVSKYKLFFFGTFKSLQKLPGQLNKAMAFSLNVVQITCLQTSSQTTIFPLEHQAAGAWGCGGWWHIPAKHRQRCVRACSYKLRLAQWENGTALRKCRKATIRRLFVLLEAFYAAKEEKAPVLYMPTAAHVCTLRVISVAEVTCNNNVSDMSWFQVDHMFITIGFFRYQMACTMWKINYKTLPRAA